MTDEAPTDDFHDVPGATADLRTELARQLAALAPEVVADGKVDIAKLAELLDDDAAPGGARERFGLFWPGKRRAIRAAQEPTTATLRPVPDESVDWDTTENVFIEGDNLETLKILRRHYHGKVKLIYIDPPYNTGKDFVYPDNYREGLQTYLRWTKQVSAEGGRVTSNPETAGRYHSNWLNMMYPRLKLARELLADDGVILISIDDTEAAHLRKLCDEVFGERNFVAAICHKSRGSVSNDRIISANHNTVLFYARSHARIYEQRHRIGLAPNLDGFDETDERGAFRLTPVDGPGGAQKGNPFYEFLGVEGFFRYSRATMQELYDAGEIVRRGNTLLRKYYLDVAQRSRRTDTTWWDDAGYTSSATSALKKLLGGAYFDSPKPTSLIIRMLEQLTSTDDDLVLDFFAGSGTTAHAVMALNAQDGGRRRCISVQLPEPTPPESDARTKGQFATIAQISRARLRLAAEQVREEHAAAIARRDVPLDTGFRAYALADTGFRKWQAASDTEVAQLEAQIRAFADSAAGTGSPNPADLLTELLLKAGYSLTEPQRTITVEGLTVDAIGVDGALLAYLDTDTKPTLDQLRAVVERAGTEKLLLLDAVFQGDDGLKTNLAALARGRGVELWTA